jgi:hypothetical protein
MKVGDLVRIDYSHLEDNVYLGERAQRHGCIGVIIDLPSTPGHQYWKVLVDKVVLFFHQTRLETIR